ncbi:magnesium transporter [Candidatus Auribacterota bacterium]
MPKKNTLLQLVNRYFEGSPVDAARFIETLPEEEAVAVLNAVSPDVSHKMMQSLHETTAAGILEHFTDKQMEDAAEYMNVQQAALIFMQMGDEEKQRFLAALSEKKTREVHEFLTYPEDSAGRIMTTDLTAFHKETTVKDAIQMIRNKASKKKPVSYIYVIDRENVLTGIVSTYSLMLAKPASSLEEIMQKDVFFVDCFTDQEQVAYEFTKRKYFVVPVVDPGKKLLGVIKAEQLLKGVQEEASEDILKMFGAGADERAFSSVWFSLKKRLPWLHVNLATAFLAAGVVAMFEGVIAKITVLAIYLPVVAGQGGNAGAQSLAVVMRGLLMREVPPSKVKQLIFKEAFIGLINGIVIGVVTAVVAWLWQGNPFLGLVIGLGMIVNLAVAGLAGAAIPITMKGIGLDPAQCSNIILTTITDVLGFFAFLGFAVIFQNLLI